MPPNDPPAPVASFERRLHTALVDVFTPDTLATLIRLDMNVTLANVTRAADFGTVATEFIDWARREGRLGEFLDRAVASVPGRPDLAALRDEHLAASVAPGALPADAVEAAIGRFANRFRERLPLFGYLNAYKHLHDLLHELSGYLGQLHAEADARRTANAAVSAATAAALRRWAAEAVRWWQRTELPNPPRLWIGQLTTAADDFLGADPAKHTRALARLASLPSANLLELNADMTRCAGRLRPEELLPDVDTARRLIGPAAAGPLADVAAAADDLRDPLSQLPQAIRHDTLCQEIDTQFREAGGLAAKTPNEILGWDVVGDNLSALDRERPGDLRTAAVGAARVAFVAAPSPATFDRLVAAFDVLFKAMDVDLKSVTTDLLTAANRLTASLGERR
ncbi:MAG: effector-associated domain EAD1-containing protein [Gemmataceae bacterium]